MRNAREFVDDYRRKGYPDDRIRIIASMRPEPLRTEALQILDAEAPPAPPAAAVAEEPKPTVAVPVESAPVAEERTAEASAEGVAFSEAVKALKAEVASVRKEREQIASELKKTKTELQKLRAEGAEANELRARVAELESVRKELDQIRSQRRETTAAKAELEGRIADLEAALVQKESLLGEKDSMLKESESVLARERGEREAAAARVTELTDAVQEHLGRLKKMEAVNRQLAKTNADLDEMRAQVAKLQEIEQVKAVEFARLEAEANDRQTEADRLRAQLGTNEQAINQLEEKITSRESELESLRAHFDHEASDLKKRAEQEMWLLQRRLRRVRQMAAMGGVLAAAVVVGLLVGYITKMGETRRLQSDLVAAQKQAREAMLARQAPDPAPTARQAVVQTVNPPARASEVVRTPALATHVTFTEPAPERPAPSRPPEAARTVETPAPSPAPAARTKSYTVQKDDNLWSIAKRELGNGDAWRTIAQENGISVTNPQLKQGMVLKISVPAAH